MAMPTAMPIRDRNGNAVAGLTLPAGSPSARRCACRAKATASAWFRDPGDRCGIRHRRSMRPARVMSSGSTPTEAGRRSPPPASRRRHVADQRHGLLDRVEMVEIDTHRRCAPALAPVFQRLAQRNAMRQLSNRLTESSRESARALASCVCSLREVRNSRRIKARPARPVDSDASRSTGSAISSMTRRPAVPK